MATIELHHIRNLLKTFTDYGIELPSKVKKIMNDAEARAAYIDNFVKTTTPAQARKLATESLANGTADAATIAAAANAETALDYKNIHGPYRRMVEQAHRLIAADAHKGLAEVGDDWVRILRPEIEQRVEIILRDAPSAEHLRSDPVQFPSHLDEFKKLGTKAGTAWREMDTLYNTAESFRTYGIIPNTGSPREHYEWAGDAAYVYEQPGIQAERQIRDHLHRRDSVAILIWANSKGIKRTLLTQDEADEINTLTLNRERVIR